MRKHLLPPFGRALLNQRQRGQHPDRVWVIYGNDCWNRKPVDAPVLCVPGDYVPLRYDWSLLAGVPADIVYRDGEFIHALAAEVARFAAPVNVCYRLDGFETIDIVGFFGSATAREPVDAFLCMERSRPCVDAIWTRDAEIDYLARSWAWLAAAAEDRLAHGQRQSA